MPLSSKQFINLKKEERHTLKQFIEFHQLSTGESNEASTMISKMSSQTQSDILLFPFNIM